MTAQIQTEALEIRVRGRVQGVGFRPTVWRFARELALGGEVHNDAQGVLIRVRGPRVALDLLLERLAREPPPLAHIESVEASAFDGQLPEALSIVESVPGAARTEVSPDAAMCAACAQEIADPFSRRYRYPFTTCSPTIAARSGWRRSSRWRCSAATRPAASRGATSMRT